MMRIWNANLAARFIALMMLALLLSQLLSFAISWGERGSALREVAKSDFLSRTASLAMLLDSTPTTQRETILQVSDTAYERYWMFGSAPSKPSDWWAFARKHLMQPLSHGQLVPPSLRQLRPDDDPPPEQIDASSNWTIPETSLWPRDRPARFIYLPQLNVMGIATPLKDGRWLHAVYAKSVDDSPFGTRALISLGITALALCVIAVLIARGITKPLRDLALAAERVGRGEIVAELPETGPADIRRTAQAFNRMQLRLHRFIEDRTRMLAAIGHDLRTPLTSLRLRTEFIQDAEIQSKMLGTLDEITAMTEAAIGYARENSLSERTRPMNITALVESLCEDLASLGLKVAFLGQEKVTLNCRPDALRRAVRNLVENAVRYGHSARVNVADDTFQVVIAVEDDGEGIPLAEQEQVFIPFYRLEQSRNRNTGGVGLGLSIAREVARQHGGDVVLTNLPHGLLAQIKLPKS